MNRLIDRVRFSSIVLQRCNQALKGTVRINLGVRDKTQPAGRPVYRRPRQGAFRCGKSGQWQPGRCDACDGSIINPITGPSSREQRVRACQGLVRSLAWQIGRQLPPEVEMEDLIGYGQVGLMEAIQDYDPNRGARFATYAYHRIRGAILDGLSQMTWFNYHDYYNRRYVSRDASAPDQADEAGGQSQGGAVYFAGHATDQVAGTAPSAAKTVAFQEARGKLRELVDELPVEVGELIRARYFRGLTLSDAAGQVGIHKSWASRLQRQALERLNRSARQHGLME